MAAQSTTSLAEAASTTRTGDIWLFRGRSPADRAIRLVTNSPVNHVAMAIVIDDLPPLLLHAELGASLPDVWTGTRHRGAQLHRLEHAVGTWAHRYGQRAWVRQLDTTPTREMENQALAVVSEYSGRAFPRTVALAWRWVRGRFRRPVSLEDIYCAELVAVTYQRMGLLGPDRPANWYDPGRFWSGDDLQLVGARLGPEREVTDIPPPPPFDG
ncbi:MAG: hypothetical protein AAGA93_16865 [Actinomycetota bacterium]